MPGAGSASDIDRLLRGPADRDRRACPSSEGGDRATAKDGAPRSGDWLLVHLGVGASSPRATYPAQFEEIIEKALKGIDIEIVNRGIPGEIAAVTAERLKVEVDRLKPDLVLWQVGTNDALARVPVSTIETTIQGAVRWLRDRSDVVLVGLQYTPRFARDEHYGDIRRAIQRIAAIENVPLVRRFDSMQFIARTKANLEMLSADQFHLNDLGYHCMAEHVAQAVISALLLRRSPADPQEASGMLSARP